MKPTPFHYARALFRAACGLPPGGLHHPTEAAASVRRIDGIIETAPPTVPGRHPMETDATRLPAPVAEVSGFLRVKVDRQKKATGCFLLFSDGQVFSGTLEGAVSDATDGAGERGFQPSRSSVQGPQASRRDPVAGERLRFRPCDH